MDTTSAHPGPWRVSSKPYVTRGGWKVQVACGGLTMAVVKGRTQDEALANAARIVEAVKAEQKWRDAAKSQEQSIRECVEALAGMVTAYDLPNEGREAGLNERMKTDALTDARALLRRQSDRIKRMEADLAECVEALRTARFARCYQPHICPSRGQWPEEPHGYCPACAHKNNARALLARLKGA